jgi:uroporphyrinogen decarboxylase
LIHGKDEIDRFLEPIAELLKTGGYIPHGDHLIPPDVSWEDFRYYRDKLNHLIDNLGRS